jgi:hypothetical protein
MLKLASTMRRRNHIVTNLTRKRGQSHIQPPNVGVNQLLSPFHDQFPILNPAAALPGQDHPNPTPLGFPGIVNPTQGNVTAHQELGRIQPTILGFNSRIQRETVASRAER